MGEEEERHLSVRVKTGITGLPCSNSTFGICLSSGLSHSVPLLFTRSKLFGTEAGWDFPCGQFGYSDTLKIYRWLLDLDWREDVAEAHFNHQLALCLPV